MGGVRRQVTQGQRSLDRESLYETTSQKKDSLFARERPVQASITNHCYHRFRSTVQDAFPIMCAIKSPLRSKMASSKIMHISFTMASPQRLRESKLSDASALRVAAAAHRRDTPCKVAEEEE